MAWSEEVRGLIDVVDGAGVPHRVTSVCRTGPWADSHHNRGGTGGCGQAVDFAGLTPFSKREVHQPYLDIFNALLPYEKQLAELIYSGAPFFIKNGVRRPIETLLRSTWEAHWDHVHSAVHLGTILVREPIAAGHGTGNGTLGGVSDPKSIEAQSPVANLVPTASGKGYWIVTVRGEVFAFGDARFYGRVDVQPASRWWTKWLGS